MKIAFLVNEFPSASETFIQSQMTGLLDRGHDVSIYTGKVRRDCRLDENLERYKLLDRVVCVAIPQNKMMRVVQGVRYILKYGVTKPLPILRSLNVFRYPVKAASLSLLYQVIPFLEHGPYDIMHCQFGDLGLQGVRLRKILAEPVKLVTSFRGYDATSTIQEQSGDYQELFQEGELFLPVCDALKQWIAGQGCPEKKIVVLPSGIDCKKFAYSKRAMPPNGPVRVVSIARLVEKKGIAYAIEAIAQVVASGRRVTYDVVGEGRIRADLERLIEERGLRAHVRLLGRRSHDEVIRLLEDAHLLVAPSVTAANGDQEGIPNVLKEAMAMGIPVISTFHSGIPELVEDGVSGFLVQERDVEGLADRLSYLIDHPERWAEMGKAGRACVETYYDIRIVNDRLAGLYEQVCGKT